MALVAAEQFHPVNDASMAVTSPIWYKFASIKTMSARSPRRTQHMDPSFNTQSPVPARRFRSPGSSRDQDQPSARRAPQQHLNTTHHDNTMANNTARTNEDEAPSLGQMGALVPRQADASRSTDLRALLLATERDMADLREECAVRGSEVITLKENVQRAHEGALRASARHHNELEDMREEYERQQGQLVEQITVLKGLSESALQDKHRIQEESTKAKINLLAMIEREREDQAQVMADYRQETEALIAEQGREITGLRHLLETARAEEEKLLESVTKLEGRREELEGDLLKADAKLSEERVLGQKRIRELEDRKSVV